MIAAAVRNWSHRRKRAMDIRSMIEEGGGVAAIASQLGVPPAQAQAGVQALLPAVMGGFKKSAQQPGGLDGLMGMIGSMGGGGLFSNVVGPDETDVGAGNQLLGGIFGSREGSVAVAQHAASTSGLDPSLLKKMLPMVAMLAAGAMAGKANGAQAGGGLGGLPGGLGGMLGNVLGGAMGGRQAAAPSGAGGLGAMLDLDGDGNPLDDILGMAGKLGRR